MSDLPEVKTIARLLALAEQYGLEELEVEEGGLKVSLRAAMRSFESDEDTVANGGKVYLWQPPAWPAEKAGEPQRPSSAQPLEAPLTGTFYAAPDPASPPFVEVGSTVEEGQTIGLIEAMKVYTEIHADRAGTVVEILVQNGRLVQHGEVLLYIDPA